MNFDVLALLFIAFSVISSLVNKWQQRQRENERSEEPESSFPDRSPQPELPDLSEWEVFQEPEPEPVREFREVRGARPVDEEDDGPEFQEVEVTRPISEKQTTRSEYRSPLADGEPSQLPSSPTMASEGEGLGAAGSESVRKAKRPKRRLRFDRNALVDAVLYKEILGKPRGEDMPW